MRLRLTLLGGLAAGALLAPLAGATPGPQIVDPQGDALGGRAAHDILSVTFRTTNGASTEFVVTIELAGPPDTGPGTIYHVWAEDTPCGLIEMSASWAAVHSGPAVGGGPVTAGSHWLCGGPGDPEGGGNEPGAGQFRPGLTIDGNTLSLTVPVTTLPAELENGTLGGLNASSAPAEPLFGIGPYGVAGVFDHASSDQTYQFGS